MRLIYLAALGAIAAIVLGLLAVTAAAAPSSADGEAAAFRACILSAPHPAMPFPVVTHDAAARQRAIALLAYEEACARTSGVASGAPTPGDRIAAVLRKPSYADRGVAYYRDCRARIPKSEDSYDHLALEATCGADLHGLGRAQVELASGYNDATFQAPRILTATRYRHLTENVRKGTWWSETCE